MRRTAEEAAETRTTIVDTARALFQERGYDGVALDDVAGGLGITRGAIYHHFGNKRGLFIAVVEETLSELRDRITEAAREAGVGWDGLRAGCDVFLSAGADERFRRIVLVDAPAVLGWSTWTEIDDRTTGASLRSGLDRLAADGQIATTDIEAMTVGLSGAMNELSLWVAAQPDAGAALDRARLIVRDLVGTFER